MARKTYEIEIINWIGQAARTKNDRFYYLSHEHHRMKKFSTIKAARAYLVENGFIPVFASAKQPTMYKSKPDRYGQSGMQATIKEVGSRFWIDSSSEGRAAWRVARAYN